MTRTADRSYNECAKPPTEKTMRSWIWIIAAGLVLTAAAAFLNPKRALVKVAEKVKP